MDTHQHSFSQAFLNQTSFRADEFSAWSVALGQCCHLAAMSRTSSSAALDRVQRFVATLLALIEVLRGEGGLAHMNMLLISIL